MCAAAAAGAAQRKAIREHERWGASEKEGSEGRDWCHYEENAVMYRQQHAFAAAVEPLFDKRGRGRSQYNGDE